MSSGNADTNPHALVRKQTALCGRHTRLETGQQDPSSCLFFQSLTCTEHSSGLAPLSPQETPWLSQATSQTLGLESPHELHDWGCVIPVYKAALPCLHRALDMEDGSVSEGPVGTVLLRTGRHGSLSPTPTRQNGSPLPAGLCASLLGDLLLSVPPNRPIK